MGAQLTKEMDEWLDRMTKLLQAREVEGDPAQILERVVQDALKRIGVDQLQKMDATQVLVAVRDGIPKSGVPLNPEFVKKNSAQIAKLVEKYFQAQGITSGGPLATFGDGVVNELEARIAKYVSELPKDVTIKREGLTLVLSKTGAAATIKSETVQIDADVKGTTNKLSLDTKDLALDITQKGASVKADAKLKVVRGSLDVLVALHARLGQLDEKDEEARAIRARIDATYEDLKIQADASLKELAAKIEYLKADPGLKQVTLELESDYEKSRAQFRLVYEKKDTKLLVKALAEADKLEVELNAKAKTASGFDIQADVKATLERVNAKIEVFRKRKDAELSFVAGLESDYKQLKAQAELIYKARTKEAQFELIAKFEATLEKVRLAIEASLKTSSWQVKAAGGVDSEGKGSGRVEALVKLGEGIQILGNDTSLKLEAGITDKQWSVFVGISLTSPPRAADVARLFRTAEANFDNAYRVLNDPGYAASNATDILAAMQKQLQAPPPKFKVDVGFTAAGGLPNAPLPSLPTTGTFGIKFSWF